MLKAECETALVEIRTHSEVASVEAQSINAEGSSCRYSLTIKGDSDPITCNSLVVATGALSIPTLGGGGFGYDIAAQFSMALTTKKAGLVPFMFTDSMKPVCERLSGISLEVEASCNNQVFAESLLFTHRGLSGPVVLQISSYWDPGDEVVINLLPELSVPEWLISEKTQHGRSLLRSKLCQKLPAALVNELQKLWWPESAEKPLAEFNNKELTTVGSQFNHWALKPSATEGYRTAEVTLGGVSTDGLNARTMEARQHPGLFFIGEVVDVSGHLGGFNFQWAWSSGFSAGMAA